MMLTNETAKALLIGCFTSASGNKCPSNLRKRFALRDAYWLLTDGADMGEYVNVDKVECQKVALKRALNHFKMKGIDHEKLRRQGIF